MASMKGYVPADKWERYLYLEMQKQLPHDWVVVSNVTWTRRSVNPEASDVAYVRDAEADFVVLVPGHGLLVVEVKGSIGFRVDSAGHWYRRWLRRDGSVAETEIDKRPVDQARANMFGVRDLVCGRLGYESKDFPGAYAFVVVYPQGKLVEGVHILEDPSVVLMAKDVPGLKSRFLDALKSRSGQGVQAKFTPMICEQVADCLVGRPYVVGKADTSIELSADLEKIQELTSNQFSALQGIFWNKRICIAGPAGSGKTLLAIWRAKAFKGDGRRVLLACYNTQLRDYLKAANPALADDIVSIDSFFKQLVARAGLAAPMGRDLDVHFRQRLPELVMDAAAMFPDIGKYDAIIVDEGQDFSEEQQMALLELLASDESSYCYFWDAGQDLYKQATKLPLGTTAMFTMKHNCRNTVKICDRASALSGRVVPPMPGLPGGVEPVVATHENPVARAMAAWQILADWRSKTNERLAVLSPFTRENSCMAKLAGAHGLKLVEDLASWDKPGAVLFSTVRSFKGLEAGGVVVVDVPVPGSSPAFSREDLYVACTRGTARLALLAKDSDAERALAQGQRS